MSHRALQRVVVRMMYDRRLRDRVYGGDPEALAREDLTAAEQAWLVSPDARAYGADPYRASRSLGALLEEYPASALYLLASGKRLEDLLGFFSSDAFHGAVSDRRALYLAFGDYLGGCVPASRGAAEPLIALERACAAARRGQHLAAGQGGRAAEGRWRLAAGVEIVSVPQGCLRWYRSALVHLGEGAGRLARLLMPHGHQPGPKRWHPARRAWVIVEARGGCVQLGTASEGLWRVLEASRHGSSLEALSAVARACGATRGEDLAILEDLRGQQLLCAPKCG